MTIVSCKSQKEQTETSLEHKVEDQHISKNNNAPVSWRKTRDLFEAHFKEVYGMTQSQLLAHAGKPDRVDDGRWHIYRWEKEGELFLEYAFRFKGGLVAESKSISGDAPTQ